MVFIYLLSDNLISRKSAISQSILVKRSQWNLIRSSTAKLTESVLLETAEALKARKPIFNKDATNLLNSVKCMGAIVPTSDQQRSRMMLEMKSMVVRYGVPAFWFTLNPSDLRNPLVLKFSGVRVDLAGNIADETSRFNSQFCTVTATMNPSSVECFFHHIVEAFFKYLIVGQSDKEDNHVESGVGGAAGAGAEGAGGAGVGGVFGPVQTYYAAVETNGLGMLHLHGLVCLQSNIGFAKLRERIQKEAVFGKLVVRYLESVIRESVDMASVREVTVGPQSLSMLPPELNSDGWETALEADSNMIAATKQMHSETHMPTCFTYKGGGKGHCRFNKPESIRPESTVSADGVSVFVATMVG